MQISLFGFSSAKPRDVWCMCMILWAKRRGKNKQIHVRFKIREHQMIQRIQGNRLYSMSKVSLEMSTAMLSPFHFFTLDMFYFETASFHGQHTWNLIAIDAKRFRMGHMMNCHWHKLMQLLSLFALSEPSVKFCQFPWFCRWPWLSKYKWLYGELLIFGY